MHYIILIVMWVCTYRAGNIKPYMAYGGCVHTVRETLKHYTGGCAHTVRETLKHYTYGVYIPCGKHLSRMGCATRTAAAALASAGLGLGLRLGLGLGLGLGLQTTIPRRVLPIQKNTAKNYSRFGVHTNKVQNQTHTNKVQNQP